MISFENEELVPLAKATEWLPRRRRGKKPHASTLYRWAKTGCKGVVLETLQVGGTMCTSREAVGRFIERLTARNGRAENSDGVSQQPASHNRINRDLDKAGL